LIAEDLQRLDLPFLTLTGSTPVSQRADIVRRFQALESPLMLISLKAGGVGLNLTAADTVIHVDPWWNPAVEAQASARAHRIGQDKPVFVYKLVVAGSIEERMLDLQARKQALADGILGSDPAEMTKFTPQDLELLLAPLA
jgi:SNF2 family DNA or RNA helicase